MSAPSAPQAIDPARCPLCGQGNRCALELQKQTGRPQPPCWCTQAQFSTQLLDRLPPAARDKACICAACAAAALRAAA